MKISFPSLGGSLLKSPEIPNKAPVLSELERSMIQTVMAETAASVTEAGVSIASHRRLPHVQAIQHNVAQQAIKLAPEAVNVAAPALSEGEKKANQAFRYIGFPEIGEQAQEVPVTPISSPDTNSTAGVVDLEAVRARVAAQFPATDRENGAGDAQEAA